MSLLLPDRWSRFAESARISRRAALAGGAGLAAVTLGASAQEATPVASPETAADPTTESLPALFGYDAFQFEFLITLGGVYERAADIGEVFATVARITDADYDSWFDAWIATAERIEAIAESSSAGGHQVSAREAYLRASSYFGAASFFTDGTHDPGRLVPTWERHRACFDAFAALLPVPAEPIEIPFEGTTLPGYALAVDPSGEPRPWIIFNNGSDGTMTDMWVEGAAAALRRGYNALMFDGPGQGAALYRQGLNFRPDWEAVITPVVDYLLTRPDVDPARIGLLGVSQAGYWVPRAVAFEPRIAAAVVDPGVMDVVDSWTAQFPKEALEALYNATGDELEQIKEEINQSVDEAQQESAELRFSLAFRMRPFGTTTFADTLLALKAYTLTGITDQISCPMLIADPDGETFWPGQSQQLYAALSGPKELARFTAAEGADLHCEPKANALRAQVFYDWFDTQLGITA